MPGEKSVKDNIRSFFKELAELRKLSERTNPNDEAQVKCLQKRHEQAFDLWVVVERQVDEMLWDLDVADIYRSELPPEQDQELEDLRYDWQDGTNTVGELGMITFVKDFFALLRAVERINMMSALSKRQIREAQDKYLQAFRVWRQIQNEVEGMTQALLDIPTYEEDEEEAPISDEN